MAKLLFGWRWHIASEQGPKSPTTRLVLLTIALHMSVKGDGAWPTLDTLTIETGLNRATVSKHVERAVKAGWLERSRTKMGTGKGWNRVAYVASFPPQVQVALDDRELSASRPELSASRPELSASRPDVNRTCTSNSTKDNSTKEEERTSSPPMPSLDQSQKKPAALQSAARVDVQAALSSPQPEQGDQGGPELAELRAALQGARMSDWDRDLLEGCAERLEDGDRLTPRQGRRAGKILAGLKRETKPTNVPAPRFQRQRIEGQLASWEGVLQERVEDKAPVESIAAAQVQVERYRKRLRPADPSPPPEPEAPVVTQEQPSRQRKRKSRPPDHVGTVTGLP